MNLITSKTEGLRPLVGNLTGKLLVLSHDRLNRRYQMPRFQIFKATGGFGCQENSLGQAVFGVHIADNESARWNRRDFIGIASDELAARAMEDTTPTKPIDPSDLFYLVFAKDGSYETGDTINQAMNRLRTRTRAALAVAYHTHRETSITDYGALSYPEGSPPPVEVRIKKKGAIWIDAN